MCHMGEYRQQDALTGANQQGSELLSSLFARMIMKLAFRMDVSQIGLDEMREYPELVPACGEWRLRDYD